MFHPLTNLEIDILLQNVKHILPTTSRDRLGDKIMKNELRTVNIDKSTGEGSHWVAYLNHQRLPYAFYFDSFGVVPPPEIIKYLKTSGKQIYYNSSQIQNIKSLMCGYYCVDFIKQFDKGRDIYDILYEYEQQPTQFNETKIKNKFK